MVYLAGQVRQDLKVTRGIQGDSAHFVPLGPRELKVSLGRTVSMDCQGRGDLLGAGVFLGNKEMMDPQEFLDLQASL